MEPENCIVPPLNLVKQLSITRKHRKLKIFKYIFFLSFIGMQVVAEIPTSIAINSVSYNHQKALEVRHKGGITLFKKNNHTWWIVLDRLFSNISVPAENQLPASIKSFCQISNFSSTVPCTILEIKLEGEITPTVIKESEDRWIVNTNINTEKINSKLHYKIDNNYNLSIYPISHSQDFLITDNEEKNTYYVVPSNKLDYGIKEQHISPYLDILNSSQGVSCALHTDRGEFKIKDGILNFTLNHQPLIHNKAIANLPKPSLDNLLFKDQEKTDWPIYRQTLHDYILQNNNAPLTKKMEKIWVDLAMGYGEDAMHDLISLNKNDPKLSKKPIYKQLLAMAYLLQGNFKSCENILKTLPPLPELELWFVLCTNNNQPWSSTVKDILFQYPPYLRDKLLLLLLSKAFKNDHMDMLKSVFASPLKGVDGYSQAFFDLYYAKYLHLIGQTDKALDIYKKLANGQNITKKVKVEATYYAFMADIDKKSNEEIINFLDKLRFDWRGDDLEIMITLKLIDYLRKKKDYAKILQIVSNMRSIYANRPESQKFLTILSDTMNDYFNQDLKVTPPLKTIALFKDFYDYVAHNTEIVEKVTDQYVTLDLLSQAAELLKKHIETINDWQKKTPLLLKLADLYLQNNKSELAQEVLQEIKEKPKPDPKIFKNLQVTTYIQQQKFPEAIKLLEENSSIEDLAKLSTVYQSLENWKQMSDTLNKLLIKLNENYNNQENIKTLKEEVIINIACAYYLSDSFPALAELKKNYTSFMKKGAQEQLFQLLTRETNKDNKIQAKQIIDDAKILTSLSNQINKYLPQTIAQTPEL